MKNKLLLTLLMLCSFACGAEDFAGEPEGAEPVEIGQVEQALFLPAGYGIEQGTVDGENTPPCYAPFEGAVCGVPRYRKVDINIYPSTCSYLFVRNEMMAAGAAMRNYFNALGWDILTWEGTKGNRSSAVQMDVRCGTTSSANFLGQTTNVLENAVNCLNAGPSAGLICRYTPSNARIFEANISNAVFGLTSAKASRFANNVIRHEIGHGLGLAHNTTSGTLMYPFAASSQHSNYTNIALIPTSAERDLIECYRPTGGTPAGC